MGLQNRALRIVTRSLFYVALVLIAALARAETASELAQQAEQAANEASRHANDAKQHGLQGRMECDRAMELAGSAIEAAIEARKVAKKDSQTDMMAIEVADAAEKTARDVAGCERYVTPSVTDRLEVFPFLGFAVDTFSANDVRTYLNPQDSGDSRTRETFGLWFQYPLYGPDHDKNGFGLYLYGQTLHGVRSTEIDCSYNQALFENPKCKDSTNTPRPGTTALYILRNASSLEGMIGLRFEFWQLQKGNGPLSKGNATLYVSRQLGLVSVANSDGDVADVNHVGLGARIREGKFRNSYIEVGRGTNDLFKTSSGDRFKVNARIVMRLDNDSSGWFSKHGVFFAHLAADVDGHDGPDAVQTYIGLAFCPWGNGKCGGD
jgi:hypothetical protein